DGVMVRVALPLTLLRVAVIETGPAASAVTLPIASTVATAFADDAQETLEPSARELPSLYLPVAVNCPVDPATMEVGPVTLIELKVGLLAPPLPLLLEPPPQPTNIDVKISATINGASF